MVPSSYARDASHLREKTSRIGFLCRALAIFRIDKLVLYHEEPKNPDVGEAILIKSIADYMNTPPYLRKRAFRLREDLRYVGLLPPLNIPTHPPSPDLQEGSSEVREGRVVKMGPAYFIDAGLRRLIPSKSGMREGQRVYLLVTKRGGRLRYKSISRRKVGVYTGFRTVISESPIRESLNGYGLKIATSRLGRDVREVVDELRSKFNTLNGPVCVAFGSYKRGLEEICEAQGERVDELFDYVLNFAPAQGVRTIRTEEAVYVVLAVLNFIL